MLSAPVESPLPTSAGMRSLLPAAFLRPGEHILTIDDFLATAARPGLCQIVEATRTRAWPVLASWTKRASSAVESCCGKRGWRVESLAIVDGWMGNPDRAVPRLRRGSWRKTGWIQPVFFIRSGKTHRNADGISQMPTRPDFGRPDLNQM